MQTHSPVQLYFFFLSLLCCSTRRHKSRRSFLTSEGRTPFSPGASSVDTATYPFCKPAKAVRRSEAHISVSDSRLRSLRQPSSIRHLWHALGTHRLRPHDAGSSSAALKSANLWQIFIWTMSTAIKHCGQMTAVLHNREVRCPFVVQESVVVRTAQQRHHLVKSFL